MILSFAFKQARSKASTRLPASGSLFFAGPRAQRERRSRPEGRASKMRVKKSKQKKGPPRRSSPGHSFVPGFSDSPSWLGRKTAGIHARRPSGVRCAWMRHGNQKRLDYRRAHTDAENRYPDPRTVCTMPSSPLGSSVLRRRRMCTSTVRSST